MREEAELFFDQYESVSNKLPKALRGGVNAGMENIVGYTSNSAWKILRACFFSWNRYPQEVSKIIEISRKISTFRNRIIGLPDDYGSLIEDDGYIQYTSLSLYPSSGGFLNKHKDGHRVSKDLS